MTHALTTLLTEFDLAVEHTHGLVADLGADEIAWRPHAASSAIGWHLGHQAAVAHYLLRNLTSAEPSIDPAIDALMDSATPETARGELPGIERLMGFRTQVAERVHDVIGRIDAGRVGAPAQLRLIAAGLLTAVVNHEYQHAVWIGEVRTDALAKAPGPPPTSTRLTTVDGSPMLLA